jgi:hypothetical protein
VASLKKQLNHDIDTNRLSVGMVRFVMIETRYMTTYKGNGVVFCRKQMKEEEQIGGGGVVLLVIILILPIYLPTKIND